MKWIKKAFKPKGDDNLADAITPRELGDHVFWLCMRQVADFLDSLKDESSQKWVKVDREDINQIELLIAFMWLYFDVLQEKKYEKTLIRMHTCFMNHMTKLNLEGSKIWQTLKKRYERYDQIAKDSKFKLVASEICQNILDLDTPKVKLMLELQLTIALDVNIRMIQKTIKSIPLKDE